MEWSEIEKFTFESGGRALIVIDGKPPLVVMSYRDYQQLKKPSDIRPMIPDRPEQVEHPEGRELFVDDLPL